MECYFPVPDTLYRHEWRAVPEERKPEISHADVTEALKIIADFIEDERELDPKFQNQHLIERAQTFLDTL